MFKQFAREMRESGERNGVTPPVGLAGELTISSRVFGVITV